MYVCHVMLVVSLHGHSARHTGAGAGGDTLSSGLIATAERTQRGEEGRAGGRSRARATQCDFDSIRSEREAVLKKEWGGKYEDNINLGSSILKEFSDGELTEIDLADGSKLGDNPDFVRAMVNEI